MKPSRRTLFVASVTVALLGGVAVGTAGAATVSATVAFPTPKGQQNVTSTILVSTVLDGGMKRYIPVGLGTGDRSETQQPVIQLKAGATLRNAIIGAPGADGVHCEGTCTLQNVWWEDVGEDAATLLGTAPAGSVMTIDGGGAKLAVDKVFQHNGPGTMIIKNFYVDDFGKLYRSCGNCRNGYQGMRHAIIENVTAHTGHVALVGINSNYHDTVRLSKITIVGDPKHKLPICQRYTGNNAGTEPVKIGSGPGGGCDYTAADITYK